MSQLLNSAEYKDYREQLVTALKPGGRFVLCTLDRTKDEEAHRLLRESPGPEANTYVIPNDTLVERCFTLEEIQDLWTPLEIEHQELRYVPSPYKGKVYDRYFWWVILKKNG